MTWPLTKRWLRNWGARKDELGRRWPGDELVAANLEPHTRAVEIHAPAENVWPWIVQFGFGKAGFYSYELLERLVGIPVTNIETIEASMQSLAVGDEVLLHPKAPGIPVAMVEPGRHICFGQLEPQTATPKEDMKQSWSFYVTPEKRDTCRLVLRACYQEIRKRPLRERAGFALLQPIDFVMEQRMLRTLKRLAENTYARHEAALLPQERDLV